MLFAALVPEFVVCCAFAQLSQAMYINKLWQEFWEKEGEPDIKNWLSMAGAFFVVMGGYVIDPDLEPLTDGNSSEGRREWKREGKQAVIRTVSVCEFEALLLQPDGETLKKLICSGALKRWQFNGRNIEDKGKADNISKTIVCVQILWMVVQCAGRNLSCLPVTPLELHVLGQIPFAIGTYALWWRKPVDVAVPIPLPREVAEVLRAVEFDEGGPCSPKPTRLKKYRKTSGGVFNIFARAAFDVGSHLGGGAELCATLMAVLQGGVHLLAWDWDFPTPAEKLMWRVSSVGVAVMPVTLYLLVRTFGIQTYVLRITQHLVTTPSFSLQDMWGAYIAAMRKEARCSYRLIPYTWTWSRRLLSRIRALAFGACLLVLGGYYMCIACVNIQAFISLWDLPADAYKTPDFLAYFPHLG